MMNRKLPSFVYFIPFYGAYRSVMRIRKLENRINQTEADLGYVRNELRQLRADLDYMRFNSYKEVQFYEARIENIYERLMTTLDINPADARLKKLDFGEQED